MFCLLAYLLIFFRLKFLHGYPSKDLEVCVTKKKKKKK